MSLLRRIMEEITLLAATVAGKREEEILKRVKAKYEADIEGNQEYTMSEAKAMMQDSVFRMFAIKNPEILYQAGENGQIDMLCPKEGFVKNVDLMNLGPRSYFRVKFDNGFDIGWAVKAAEHGHLITRKGWNGKGMFVFLRPGDSLPEKFVIDVVKSLPLGLKEFYKNYPVSWDNEGDIYFRPYFCLKGADGLIVNGWVASQTDLLARDWNLFVQ